MEFYLGSNENSFGNDENIFNFFINNISDVLIEVSLDGTVNYVNPPIFDLLGFQKEEFLGTCIFDFVHPDDYSRFSEVIKKTRREGTSLSIEYRLRHKKGHYVYVYGKGNFVKIEGNVKVISILRDITKRRKVEEDLKESTRKLEIMNKVIRRCNEEVNLNNGLKEILDLTLNLTNFFGGGIYLVDKNKGIADLVCFQNLPQDFIDDAKEAPIEKGAYKQIFIEGIAIFASNYAEVNPERAQKWGIASIASIPLFSEEKIVGALNIAQIKKHEFLDVEKEILMSIGREIGVMISKIKAQEELKESEEKFRTIAEQSLCGISIFHGNTIKFTNTATSTILGYSIQEILQMSLQDMFKLFYFEDLPLIRQRFQEFQKNQDNDKVNHYSCRIIRKSREIRWIEIIAKYIKYQGESALLVSLIDISDKKEVEQELINLNKMKSEFLTRASHELKTPLISIKGFTDILLESYNATFDKIALSSLKEIKKGCQRLEKTIKSIINATYMESPVVQFNPCLEDLASIVRSSVKELEHLALSRNQSITLNIQEYLVIALDKEKINEVLRNLIINAINYTPPKGRIEIITRLEKDSVIVTVKDTGIGIIEEERGRLFQQFGKIERYGQGWDIVTEGSGLGLFISKRIVELHGGKIWVESEGRNKGAQFNFSLPLEKKL